MHAMLDQETDVRGYLIAGGESFLEAYHKGGERKRGRPPGNGISMRRVARSGSRSFPAVAFESASQSEDFALQPSEFADLQAACCKNATRGLPRPFPKRTSAFGQTHPHLTLIVGVTGASDVAQRLKPLQQRRERARFEEQFFAETSDRLIVLLPKDDHRQILRIGQAQRVQERLVDPVERVAGRIDCEAQEPRPASRRRPVSGHVSYGAWKISSRGGVISISIIIRDPI